MSDRLREFLLRKVYSSFKNQFSHHFQTLKVVHVDMLCFTQVSKTDTTLYTMNYAHTHTTAPATTFMCVDLIFVGEGGVILWSVLFSSATLFENRTGQSCSLFVPLVPSDLLESEVTHPIWRRPCLTPPDGTRVKPSSRL